MPSTGTYGENISFPMPDPIIRQVETPEGLMWEVSGLGMTTYHRQLWQAELIWVCMCTAKGFKPNNDQ